MTISNQDQRLLHNLSEMKDRHRELYAVLEFYEKLLQIQFEFKGALCGRGGKDTPLELEVSLSRLANGIPQVTFNDLNLDPEDFVPLFERIRNLLVHYAAYSDKIEKEITTTIVLETARTIFESRNPVVLSDQTLSIATMASGFALMPYLQKACESIMPQIAQTSWQRGYCPVCGGKPAFAALARESGARTLLCSRCSSEWSYQRVGCPFCEHSKEQIYYPSSDGVYRLHVCSACNRYLKTIDLRAPDHDVYLPVECIVTVSMDMAAQKDGYRHY